MSDENVVSVVEATGAVSAEVIPTKVTDSPSLRHGKQYYLANYDWDEREGFGDFTYVDRVSGEASQVQRSQRRYWVNNPKRRGN